MLKTKSGNAIASDYITVKMVNFVHGKEKEKRVGISNLAKKWRETPIPEESQTKFKKRIM